MSKPDSITIDYVRLAEAKQMDCPTCTAISGEDCIDDTNTPQPDGVHPDRWNRYKKSLKGHVN